MGYDDVRFTAIDELRPVLGAVSSAEVGYFTEMLSTAPRVFLAGAGRSGLAMRAFAMRLMHMGIDSHVPGDATAKAMRAGDLIAVGSGSGRTGSLVSICQNAKNLGGLVALITTDADSPIGKMADAVVCIPAPTPKGTPRADGAAAPAPSRQPMASLFEQALWILLDSCIMLLMQARGESSSSMFERHANLE